MMAGSASALRRSGRCRWNVSGTGPGGARSEIFTGASSSECQRIRCHDIHRGAEQLVRALSGQRPNHRNREFQLIRFVQHVAHPQVELEDWPDADRGSRLVIVFRGLPSATPWRDSLPASPQPRHRAPRSARRFSALVRSYRQNGHRMPVSVFFTHF
jgi:hypothetical protein